MPSSPDEVAQARKRALNKNVDVIPQSLPPCLREPERIPYQCAFGHRGRIERNDLEVLRADRFAYSAMATEFNAKPITLRHTVNHLSRKAINVAGIGILEPVNAYQITYLWDNKTGRSHHFVIATMQMHHVLYDVTRCCVVF